MSQSPQCIASVSVLTHAVPHTVPEQVLAHFAGELDASQISPEPAHTVSHEPQCAVVSRGVSQPSLASPLQSPNPGAQDDASKPQSPASQLTSPLTCGRLVQSFVQAPQLAGFVRSVSHPVPPPRQSSKPFAHR